MRRVFYGFVIAAMTFLVGLSVSRITGKNSPTLPRFTPTIHACGPAIWAGYATNDGQHVEEGVSAADDDSGNHYQNRIRDAKRVISQDSHYRTESGAIVERIILENEPNEQRDASFSILKKNRFDHIYRYIDAPSLDLALEFEQYLDCLYYHAR